MHRQVLRRIVLAVALAPVFIGVFLLLPAGGAGWTRGLAFIGVFALLQTAAVVCMWRMNPELLAARASFHKGTKRWDKVLLWFFAPAVLAVFPVAALDDGRFHWSSVPLWVSGFGYVLVVLGMSLLAWAASVNKFAEPTVRIQTDRGHYVIDTGPYAYVRHPWYVSAFLWLTGAPLAMGSWWALVPAGVALALLLLRTALEDRTLEAELPGYAEYARRVRYRLLPGVW